MAILSKRQRREIERQAKAGRMAVARGQVVAAAEREPVRDEIAEAEQAERNAANAAVRSAEAEAEAQGKALTTTECGAIRSDYGVQRMSDPAAPAAYRLKSRDGMTTMAEAGSLSSAELKGGLAYRLCWEAQAAGLKSALANAGSIGGGAALPVGFGPRDKAALHRAYLMARLGQMERALTPRQLIVVRAVAGEGQSIRSLGGGGKARATNAELLKAGLSAISALLNEGGLRIGGQ